jgi:hypothetical protein
MQMTLIPLLFVLALILLIIAIFPIPCRVSLLAAGLASAMLGYVLGAGLIPESQTAILVGVLVLCTICWFVTFGRTPKPAPAAQ